jgi:hypothetical protein
MSSGGTSARLLPEKEAKELWAESGDADGLHSHHCALLRSCLWALTRQGTPTHVLRLLNLAVDVAAARDGQAPRTDLRDELRQSLEDLADAGDAVSLAEGHWLPAAAREGSQRSSSLSPFGEELSTTAPSGEFAVVASRRSCSFHGRNSTHGQGPPRSRCLSGQRDCCARR